MMKSPRIFTALAFCLTLLISVAQGQETKKKGEGAMPYPGSFEGAEKHIYKTVGDVELPLYLYKPEGWKKKDERAAIVFYFGGGWTGGSPTQFREHCKYLASRGMVAATVEYRVKSRHGVVVEDCVEDAKSAMRWVRAHADEFGIDPDRIASGGGSAGGHLGGVVGLIEGLDGAGEDPSVSAMSNAMVLFNPVMALAPREELSEDYNERMAGIGDRIRGEAAAISPIEHVAKNQPPMIMFFGTADGLKEGADLFLKKYREAGNQCEMKTYEDMPHGFFNFTRYEGEYYRKTLAEMDAFLVSLGYLDPKKNAKGANVIPEGVSLKKDLVYAERGEKKMLLDLYRPAGAASPLPVGDGRTEEEVANSNGAKLLGATVREVPELAREASAIDNVSADDAPFLIMHGDADPGVPMEQSVRFHEKLVAAGVPATLEIVAGAGHGGELFTTDEVKETVRKFFEEWLK